MGRGIADGQNSQRPGHEDP